MLYGTIPHVDRPVSRIVFGTAMPTMFNAFRSVYENAPDFPQRLQAAFDLLDAVYALGVNCFDCADHYGEEPLGEWIVSRGLQDKVVVLAKGAHHNRWRKRITDFDILHDAHNSLAKLGVKKLDLYLLHRDDPAVPVGPIVDVLNRLYDEGKIGAFGGSNWTRARIEEANEYAAKHGLQGFTVSSPHYSLADQVCDLWGGGCVTLTGADGAAERAYYAHTHMPVFAYSSLARGFFSGKFTSDQREKAEQLLDPFAVKGYLAPVNLERLRRCEELSARKGASVSQIALAWLFAQSDLDLYALISTSSPARMRQNIDALDLKLTDGECRYLLNGV